MSNTSALICILLVVLLFDGGFFWFVTRVTAEVRVPTRFGALRPAPLAVLLGRKHREPT